MDGQPRLPRAAPASGTRRRPRSSRRAAGRSRSGAGRRVVRRYARSRRWSRATLDDLGLVGWPKTSGSRGMHIYVRIERALDVRPGAPRRAGASRAKSSGARPRWRRASGGRRSATASSSTTTRTPRTARSPRPIRSGRRPDARVSAPLTWDEIADCDPADFTLATMPARFAASAIRTPASTSTPCSLDALLELSARQERDGLGDAPWPPHYRKQAGEPPRVAAVAPPHADASADRDRTRAAERGCARGTRALEGAAPGRGGASAAGRRARRCDARPLHGPGRGSGSICSTSRTSSGRRRSRSIPTSTPERLERRQRPRTTAPKTFSSS